MRAHVWGCSLALLGFSSSIAFGDVIYVTDFSTLSSAINSANAAPNSTIYLAPGTYTGGELPDIRASVTIAIDPGAQAGSAVLETTPTGEEGLLTVPFGVASVNLTVDGITFEGASISDAAGGNGAGIRDQSSGTASLLVSNSTFLSDQDGILTGDGDPNQDQQLMITVSNSLFANNGNADSNPNTFGREHAIYAFGQSLNVSGSAFCGTLAGHDIKSRTAVTIVTNSVLYDGASDPNYSGCGVGSTSYALDAPSGGQVSVSGDQFIQGDATDNSAVLSYGEEGIDFSNNSLTVDNSSFTSTTAGRGIQELEDGVPTCLVTVQLSATTFSPTLVPVTPPNCSAEAAPPQPVNEPGTGWMYLAALAACGFVWRRARAMPRSWQ